MSTLQISSTVLLDWSGLEVSIFLWKLKFVYVAFKRLAFRHTQHVAWEKDHGSRVTTSHRQDELHSTSFSQATLSQVDWKVALKAFSSRVRGQHCWRKRRTGFGRGEFEDSFSILRSRLKDTYGYLGLSKKPRGRWSSLTYSIV